jgi:YggT family protein
VELLGVGAAAAFGLLGDAITAVERFVTIFVSVYTLLIFVYILTSWVRLPYSLRHVQRFLYDVCEPYLRLFRRILPPVGPLDLSPFVGVMILWLLERILVTQLFDRLR